MTTENQSALKLSQIGQIALTVKDVARAITFYQEKLGMTFLFRAEDMAFFDCDGIRLMLAEPEGDPNQPFTNSVLYFRVADLQASYATLLSRGVEFDDQPHLIARLETVEVWMCFFRDSEGSLLGLMSEVPIA